jgi:hypothetical protein
MPGRAQRKPSKDIGHGIDSADGAFLTPGSPLVSPGVAGYKRCWAIPPIAQRASGRPRTKPFPVLESSFCCVGI